MNISIHLITSTILTIVLFPFLGIYSLWILVGGYLIDLDHYLWTIFRLKSFSLKKSYNYHLNRCEKENYEKDLLHIFHTIEFYIFMLIASIILYNQKFLFYMSTITLLGMIFHITLDITDLTKKKRLNARAISLIMWIIRRIKYS